VLIASSALPAAAQESRFAADLRREKAHIADACGELRTIDQCVHALATDYPLHVALGSLAPLNGFAFGLALSERYTPNEAWRISWNADAVSTLSGSWRAGAYMKLVHTPETSGVVVAPPGTVATPPRIRPRSFTTIDVFAQALSLEAIDFYGSGPSSLASGRSRYAQMQTILGGVVRLPLPRFEAIAPLAPSVTAGVNARFIDVTSRASDGVPGVAALYDDRSAPGLATQKAFVQFHESVRIAPSIANGWMRLDYRFGAEQFRTSADTRSSFNRWVVDLEHEIPIVRKVLSTGAQAFNGPNDCSTSIATQGCRNPQWSRNRHGTIRLRGLLVASTTSGDNRVPFYLQPTLGGSDLNGERRLASFDDYRFRDGSLLALQQSVEYSLWGPIGAFVQTEQGAVAARAGALSARDVSSSTTIGLTLRAGGFPMVNLSFSWGGGSHHVIGAMDASLLGGSSRPRLY
jgi:hypothetical protein